MTSRKDIFSKYYVSDIFNIKPSYGGVTPIAASTRPRIRYNRSSLENTKEEVFNIGKEKRINRNINRNEPRNERLNHSAEKRRKNLTKIYGSDIFNRREDTSKERKKGKLRIKNDNNKSTCFEEMKNNDEYIKNLKFYTKQHKGEKKPYNADLYMHFISPQERYFNSYYGNNLEGILPGGTYLHSEGNIDESKLKYIKKKINLNKEERLFNDVGVDKKRKEGEKVKEVRYLKNHPISIFRGDRRRFVDINEFPENNCKINKQIQFESHIFTNENNNYNKSNDEIKEINDRIYKEKNKHYHLNVLGQPIIRVNRNKNIVDKNAAKLRPANIKWNTPQAEVMFGRDHSCDIYKKYGPNGPNAYQLKLYQFADSGNIDTINGVERHHYQSVGKHIDDKLNNETSKKIEKMVEEIPNLNDRKRLEIKMNTSVLDCRNDNEWDYKSKTLNDFYKKGNNKKKQKEVTGKVNRNDKKIKENKTTGVHDYVITYSNKGNQFDKFNDNDIKKMFGAKGVNVFDVHKNPFTKGNVNTISIKVFGNDNNNEISKKVQLVQDDLKKNNYKLNIEKGKEKNYNKNHRKIINIPGSRIGIMPDANSGENKLKIMPNDYKKRRGFTKEFSAINYSYKKPNQ